MAAAKRTRYVLQPPSEIHILSYLDAKHAVQASSLSKPWANLWTRIPVFDFNYLAFTDLDKFESFVRRVLSERDDIAKLDTVKFNAPEINSLKTLKEVFDYAIKHGVKQLEASIERVGGFTSSWPAVPVSDSLTSLKLHSEWGPIRCPFPGPNTPFMNVTILYLNGALITDEEPFVGFPML
ncbi:hypothetical protein LXL04_018658 [Taraxacum kok-saghyz]